jgi:hypothetical protein
VGGESGGDYSAGGSRSSEEGDCALPRVLARDVVGLLASSEVVLRAGSRTRRRHEILQEKDMAGTGVDDVGHVVAPPVVLHPSHDLVGHRRRRPHMIIVAGQQKEGPVDRSTAIRAASTSHGSCRDASQNTSVRVGQDRAEYRVLPLLPLPLGGRQAAPRPPKRAVIASSSPCRKPRLAPWQHHTLSECPAAPGPV